jgi:acetyltransferase
LTCDEKNIRKNSYLFVPARRIPFRPLRQSGEYAILLRSDLKGRGHGWLLMQTIIDYALNDGNKR